MEPRGVKVSCKLLFTSVVTPALHEDLCTFLRSLAKLVKYLLGRKMFHTRVVGTNGTRRKRGQQQGCCVYIANLFSSQKLPSETAKITEVS
jgi:hypothetical protein